MIANSMSEAGEFIASTVSTQARDAHSSCEAPCTWSTDGMLRDIVELASMICEAPFAVLTMNGFSIKWCASLARIEAGVAAPANTFDQYVVQQPDMLEVSDLRLDERFAASHVIDEQPMNFYAGVCMRSGNARPGGSLAVFDAIPRRLTTQQRCALQLLARSSASHIAAFESLSVARARLESAPVAIYHTNDHGEITYVNPEYRRFLGLSPVESLSNWANGVHVDDRPRMMAAWDAFCRNPQPVSFEWRTSPRSGAIRVLTEKVVAAEGTPGFIGTITDITERVEARARLESAETLSQSTFEQAPIGIVCADRDGRILRGNPAFSNHLGFEPHLIDKMTMAQLTHESDVAHNTTQLGRLWQGEIGVIDNEMRYLCRDRSAVWVRVTTALLRDSSGTPTCAVAFVRDISARKDLAAALTQNQRLLETVIADIPVAIQACDVDGRVFLHNPVAAEFFAIPSEDETLADSEAYCVDILLSDGKTPVPSEDRPLARALRGEIVSRVELVIKGPGDQVRRTRSSARRLTGQQGECLGAVAITQDVTQEQKIERELAHSHKMESIGQLAAGIAHEINTPTQFIGDNIRFLRDSFQDILDLVGKFKTLVASAAGEATVGFAPIALALEGADLDFLQDEIPKAIAQSLNGVERIAKIVGAMKDFSHPSSDMTTLDLNRAIASTITVASSEWKYVADVRTEFDPQLPLVPVIPGSFNQVILNMIVNAAHAISAAAPEGASPKGVITLRTKKLDNWVEIAISDTGCGIPPETIPRIFDLFFTTKPVGMGTGQGLAIAHDVVVTKHGGTISVDSEVGVGTTFSLRLPLHIAASSSAEAA